MGYRTYTCPIARECGGCEWLAVPYPIQLKRKNQSILDLFGEPVHRDGATINEIIGMQQPCAFRHKAATPFAPARKKRIRSGFYAAGSHRIIPCEHCLVEHPRARPILTAVAKAAERLGISAYDENRGRGSLRHAVVRVARTGNEALLTLVTNGQRLRASDKLIEYVLDADPQLTGIVQNINQKQTNAILGSESHLLWGNPKMHDRLLGCSFSIGPTSFFQTNPEQTEVLYQIALEAANLKTGMRVLDAYCGTGTIGICAAHKHAGIKLVGVETSTDAVEHAKANAEANALSQTCSFIRADASAWISSAARKHDHFDVVFLDPPRAGATDEFLDALATLAPERVVYVSCNPTTQLRDVLYLREHGYRLEQISPVDMFPHTKHVECVSLLVHTDTR